MDSGEDVEEDMRRAIAVASATLVLALGLPAAANAEVTRVTAPLDVSHFVSCANGGAGEFVHVTGTLQFRISDFTDGDGGLHHTTQIRPLDVTAVGLTTGDKYKFTSLSKDIFNQKTGSVLMSINNFRLTGPGPGNDDFEHNLVHVTLNANGTVTADFFPVHSGCT
jgi:hypothetical protein